MRSVNNDERLHTSHHPIAQIKSEKIQKGVSICTAVFQINKSVSITNVEILERRSSLEAADTVQRFSRWFEVSLVRFNNGRETETNWGKDTERERGGEQERHAHYQSGLVHSPCSFCWWACPGGGLCLVGGEVCQWAQCCEAERCDPANPHWTCRPLQHRLQNHRNPRPQLHTNIHTVYNVQTQTHNEKQK